MKVKNLRGSFEPKCEKCGSWLDHWERLTGKDASLCANINCKSPFDVTGAHVHRVEPVEDMEDMIVPLCGSCQHEHNTSPIDIMNTPVVPAKNCK